MHQYSGNAKLSPSDRVMSDSPLPTLCYQPMRLSFYCQIKSIFSIPQTPERHQVNHLQMFSQSADCISASPPSGIIFLLLFSHQIVSGFSHPTHLSTRFPVPDHSRSLPELLSSESVMQTHRALAMLETCRQGQAGPLRLLPPP